MIKSFIKSAVMVLIFALAASSAVMAADAGKKHPVAKQRVVNANVVKHHVVFHVTDSDPVKWNQALNNASNLQKNIGKDNVDIEIVANGPGLDMMKLDSEVGGRMSDALNNGIVLMACGATMKAAKLTDKDLFPGLAVVPGGIIEIMLKQEAGWTYIKM